MSRLRIQFWQITGIFVVGLTAGAGFFFFQTAAVAQDSATRGETPPAIQMQPADDVATPLPTDENTADEADGQARQEALAWFGAGQLREARGEFRAALEAYRKAIEADPNAVAVYQSLVPLAFSLNETEEGLRHAFRLIELQPDNVGLLQQLARVLVGRGQLPRAAELLRRGVESPTLDRRSETFISLQRDLGVIEAAQGNLPQAADAFEFVLAALLNPEEFRLDDRQRAALAADAETTFERLGEIFLEADRLDSAEKAFEGAANARNGKPGVLRYNLARLYLRGDRPDDALAQLDLYLDRKRTDRGRAAYDLLVEVLTALDRESAIIPRLEKISENEPKNDFVRLTLAEQYLAAERLEDAEAALRTALKSHQDPRGYLALASISRQAGQVEQLLDSLARAAVAGADDEQLAKELETVGENEKLIEQLLTLGQQQSATDPPQLDFASAYLLARLAVGAERWKDAATLYEFAEKVRPDRAVSLAEEHAQYLADAEHFDEAAAQIRSALAKTRGDDAAKVALLFRLSGLQELAGETEAALKTAEEAITIAPDAAPLHYQIGWINLHAKRYEAAERALLNVAERFADNESIVRQARLSLSALYVEQGRPDRGLEVLEAVYESDPADPGVNNDLGYLYADQGIKLDQAEAMIRLALKAEPENPAYLDSLGWVLFQRKKYKEAVDYLQQAVDLPGGQDPTLYEHLADAQKELQQPKQAEENWRKALELATKDRDRNAKQIERLKEKLAK